MYNGNPDLFIVYECGYTSEVGKEVVVKKIDDYYMHHDGASVYLEEGGHFNCYWQTKGHYKASEFKVGDVLRVEDLMPVSYYNDVVLRRMNRKPDNINFTLLDHLLT